MKYKLIIEFKSINASYDYIFNILKPLLEGTIHDLQATDVEISSETLQDE